MTIKMYPSSYVSKEETARQREAAERVAIEFQEEFEAMCAKYKVEFSVREYTSGYQSYAEGIDVDFDGIYEDGETVRPYFTVQFGSTI
jgi:hypothetical protein